jgi:hypothetical protein
MDVEHQQGTWECVRRGTSGEGGTRSAVREEGQIFTALNWKRALVGHTGYNCRGNRHVRTRMHGGVGGRGP